MATAEEKRALIEALLPLLPPQLRKEAHKALEIAKLLDSDGVEVCQSCDAAHLVKWNEGEGRYEDFHVGQRTLDAASV